MDSKIYDLCIVGAGMFGSAAARHASAMAGIKVCLIGPDEPTPEERLTREIFSAHYDEGRIVRTMDDDIPSQILYKESMSRFRELEELSGIQFYHPVGCIWVAQKNSYEMKKILHLTSILKLPVVDLSYNDIFERRYPFIRLREDDHPILDDFGAGHISPRNMVAAQKKVAKCQGCDIIPKIVNEVKPLVNGIHEIITEDGKVVQAKRVLICTGAFTNLKKFPMPRLKISINKETVAFFKIHINEAKRLSSMPSIIYVRPEIKLGAYVLPPIQYPNGNYYLKIGHIDFEQDGSDDVKTLEQVRNWYLSKGDPAKIKSLSKLLIDMLPGLMYEEISQMTCVTSKTPSTFPYIDRVTPTVTVAAVGSAGAKIAEEVGRIASVLSLTGKWDSEIDKSLFSIILDKAANKQDIEC